MKLVLNIPDEDIPNNQTIIDISLGFMHGVLIDYTVPSGWSITELTFPSCTISNENNLNYYTMHGTDFSMEDDKS